VAQADIAAGAGEKELSNNDKLILTDQVLDLSIINNSSIHNP
jgi:hypothetical protein